MERIDGARVSYCGDGHESGVLGHGALDFIACMLMEIWENFPIALGPAIGLSRFMAFYVVKTLGMSWQNGLACVCISGCSFMLLGLLRVQQKNVDGIPACIKQALGAGVSFLSHSLVFRRQGLASVPSARQERVIHHPNTNSMTPKIPKRG